MVELRTPRVAPTVRQAGQVQTGKARAMASFAGSLQTAADKYSAYNEQKAGEEAELIWSQAQVDWTRQFKERAKTAGDGFTGTTLKEYDAYVDGVMKTVPLRRVDEMNHAFAKYRINLEAKSLEVEAAARARARAARQAKIKENIGHAILEDPTWDGYQEITDGQSENVRKYAFGLMVDSTLNSGDRFAIEDLRGLVEDQSIADHLITPKQELAIRKGVDKAEAIFAREDAALAQGMTEDAAAMAANTGEADTTVLESFISDSYMSEGDKQIALDIVEDSVSFGKATFEIRDQPVSASSDTLDEMRRSASSAADWKNVGVYSTALSAHQTAMGKDIAGYIHATDMDIGDLEEAAFAQDGAIQKEGFEYYTAAMDAKYDRMGVPEGRRRYLSKGRVGSMVSTFNGMENGLTGPALEAQLLQWGENKPQIMSELVDGDLNNFVSWQLFRYDDPVLNAMAAKAKNANLPQVKEKFTTQAYSDLEKNVYAHISDYMVAFPAGRGPKADRFIRDMAATAIDMYMVHKDGGGTMPLNSFLDRAFSEEELVEEQAVMLLPDGVSKDMVSRKTQMLIADATTSLIPSISPELRDRIAVEENQTIDDTVLASLLQGGRGVFVLNDANNGVRLAYNLQGIMVPLNPEYTFKELSEYKPELTVESAVTGEVIPKYFGLDDPNLAKDIENGVIRGTTRIMVGGKEIQYTVPRIKTKGKSLQDAFQ